MKTPRSDRIQKSADLPFSTPSPEVPSKESTTISHSNETKSQNSGGKNIHSLENQIFHHIGSRETVKREKFASPTAQHVRSRREIDEAISENNESSTECANFTFTIKYEDEYKVWNNFSILYKNKVYDYTEYRVLHDGIKICNSIDNYVRNTWKVRNYWVKKRTHRKSCNEPNRTVQVKQRYYTVNKKLDVYVAPTDQHFTRNDYGVRYGKLLVICKEKLGPYSTDYTQEDLLMCNDSIINIKYDDEYKVWTNFSILYKNKVYDYTKYRVLDDSIKICNSTDNHVRNIWKLRNDWVKQRMHLKSCNKPIRTRWFYKQYYTVNKQFTVYLGSRGQYFTRNDYGVRYGEPYICEEKLGHISTEYTKEDLLMCNDSIINIKYDDEYKVWNNFSILYKNKVYDYTEYLVLKDSIKICNSTDNHVRNIWKVRNDWVKGRMLRKSCNKPIRTSSLSRMPYTVNKQFNVYLKSRGQYFTRNGYVVRDGALYICQEKLKPESTEYTQEDLLMCNDSIINIKYDEEYKVWTNFSILYKNKVYDYTEYRVLNDSIKICNSTDNDVRNIWKVRNDWVKERMHLKSCKKPDRTSSFYRLYYTVNKQFTVYVAPHRQYFTRNNYGVINGKLMICREKLRHLSNEYTQEDLSMCNDSILNIKYDDEYKVWTNFSILYKNKVYDYTEYRVLNDGIKICNSTDNYVRNIWKLRNDWVKKRMHLKSCKKTDRTSSLSRMPYTVNKQFTAYLGSRDQYFARNDYVVRDGELYICKGKLRPLSTEYTKEDLLMCYDSIINIKYDDEYKVWTNFSILYKNKVYDYTEYRVLNDSIKICNSTDNDVRNIWKVRNGWVKDRMHYRSCEEPARTIWLYRPYYTVTKQFTVHYAGTSRYFTRNTYGVVDGKPYICQEKLRLTSTEYTQDDLSTCNNSIINIKYDDEYKVWTNFSIRYRTKVYDYTEYRVLNDGIKICNSTDNDVRNNWKYRNYWVKKRMHFKSCNEPNNVFVTYREYYAVNKQFTVYLGSNGQYFTRNDYAVIDGQLNICKEKLRPTSTEYTQKDLLMCNDSTINIKYDDKYKVWNDFSILYTNKVYSYIEYRVLLNDGIKICNSSDNDIRNIWKVRNHWLKATMHFKSCNKPITYTEYNRGRKYTVLKDFSVLIRKTNQVIPKNDYGMFQGILMICDEKLFLYITNIKITIVPLCALALSFICLLLLLIIYCILPELRTLPGLNLMSLSFAFLLWQTYLVAFLSLYSRVGKLLKTPCDRLFITTKFITYSILMHECCS